MKSEIQNPRAETVKPATILIVDDHPDARRLLALLLAREGYRLLLAPDGPEALRIAESTPDLSLAILDVMMPGMDGLEVCRRLRARGEGAYVPIILATALTDEAHLVAGLQAGADDYVTKPFSHPELLARIRTALRLKRAMDQLLEARELGAVAAMQITLAHEINNPLTIVQGNLELLLGSCGTEGATPHRLKAALDACLRIRELVRQLVELKRVTTTTYIGSTRMLDLSGKKSE